jgi:hypothetical protein
LQYLFGLDPHQLYLVQTLRKGIDPDWGGKSSSTIGLTVLTNTMASRSRIMVRLRAIIQKLGTALSNPMDGQL